MSQHFAISDEELHAFIDGELDEARRRQVEELAARETALARRVALFRADKERLAMAYGGLLERPVPESWLRLIRNNARKQMTPSLPMLGAIAATFVVLLMIGALIYRQAMQPTQGDIVAEALAARSNEVVPRIVENIVPNMNSAAPASQMAKALKMRVKAPDLSKMGYRLTQLQIFGGVPGGQAVELIYRGKQEGLFTLYLRHSNSAPRFDQFERDGVRVCIWQDDVVGTVMAGKVSAPEMQRLASLSYTGLTL